MTYYQEYIVQLLRLHAAMLDHGPDSKEADEIRDFMDISYYKCSNSEQDCLGDLSAKLNYMLDYFKDKPYD